jgi:hypothetical protein
MGKASEFNSPRFADTGDPPGSAGVPAEPDAARGTNKLADKTEDSKNSRRPILLLLFTNESSFSFVTCTPSPATIVQVIKIVRALIQVHGLLR